MEVPVSILWHLSGEVKITVLMLLQAEVIKTSFDILLSPVDFIESPG